MDMYINKKEKNKSRAGGTYIDGRSRNSGIRMHGLDTLSQEPQLQQPP